MKDILLTSSVLKHVRLPILSGGIFPFPHAQVLWVPLFSGNGSVLAYALTRIGNRMPLSAVSAPGKYIRSGTCNCKA